MTSIDISQQAAKLDRSDMASAIASVPDQIEYALQDSAFPTIPTGPFRQAVVLGMGGSALPADVLNGALPSSLKSPVLSSRHYVPSAPISGDTLAIVSSYSGNTEETLAALEAVPTGNNNIVIITHGGKLDALAEERNIPLIHIPGERHAEGFQPRCATGYFVAYLARTLCGAGLLTPDGLAELQDSVCFLKQLDVRSEAEAMTSWIGDRTPVYYTDAMHSESIGRVAKIKFNENAKRPSFYNDIPEVNHNEMIGYSGKFGTWAIIYLRDTDSVPGIDKRFDVMKRVFTENGLDHVALNDWTIPGKTPAQKTFAGIMFADWIAYSAAILRGIDPSPVNLVEEFKAHLK